MVRGILLKLLIFLRKTNCFKKDSHKLHFPGGIASQGTAAHKQQHTTGTLTDCILVITGTLAITVTLFFKVSEISSLIILNTQAQHRFKISPELSFDLISCFNQEIRILLKTCISQHISLTAQDSITSLP